MLYSSQHKDEAKSIASRADALYKSSASDYPDDQVIAAAIMTAADDIVYFLRNIDNHLAALHRFAQAEEVRRQKSETLGQQRARQAAVVNRIKEEFKDISENRQAEKHSPEGYNLPEPEYMGHDRD